MKRQLRVPASIEDKQSFSIPRLAPERQFEIGELYLFHRKIVDVPLFPLCGVFSMAIKKVDCLWNRAVIICVVSATGIFYRKSIAIADVPVGMNYATIYRD